MPRQKNQDPRSTGSDDKMKCQDLRSTGSNSKITELGSKIYRIPQENHLVRIQDLQDLTTKQKFRIQDLLQDPTAITKNKIQDLQNHTIKQKNRIQDTQDPGFPGSQYRSNFKDPRSHNKMNVQSTRSTGSRNKMPRVIVHRI